VATDQRASIIDTDNARTGSVIENELPTYRAISAIAIFSVVCGGLAVCSFAEPIFYVFSILAVGLGIWAHRTIRRHPDMLTGRGLANAGITLGLVFGLASGTITTVQYLVRSRQAEKFARKFVEILKSPSMGTVILHTSHPDMVKNKTPEELLQEFDAKQSDPRHRMEQSMSQISQLLALRKRLTESKDQVVRFVRIEGVGEEDGHGPQLQMYALALLEVTGPASKEFPETRQYALAILKARPKGRQYEWWAESVRFPYVPQSFVAPAKPVDDGHDHPH
jgi:hypothetical protein